MQSDKSHDLNCNNFNASSVFYIAPDTVALVEATDIMLFNNADETHTDMERMHEFDIISAIGVGNRLISCSKCEIIIWNTQDHKGEKIQEQTQVEQVCAISENTFASRHDKTIQIWNTDSKSSILTLRVSRRVVCICGAGPNSLIGSTRSKLMVFDLKAKTCLNYVDLDFPTYFLGYSNGKIISVDANTINMWDENELSNSSNSKGADLTSVPTGLQIIDSDTFAVGQVGSVSLWSISRFSVIDKIPVKSTTSSFCFV